MRWNRRRRERDLDAELRAHLEMAANDAHARGESVEAARLAALREFGNRDLVKETTRDIWGRNPFHGVTDDLRAGLRTFRKSPSFAAIVVVTLALGIGANTAIFSLIDTVMLRSLPVQNPEQLVLLARTRLDAGREPDLSFSNPVWEEIRNRQDIFSGIFATSDIAFDLAQGGEAHSIKGMYTSGDFFNTLGVQPAAGRLLNHSDDVRGCPGAVVLSYGFWQEHYGGAQ